MKFVEMKRANSSYTSTAHFILAQSMISYRKSFSSKEITGLYIFFLIIYFIKLHDVHIRTYMYSYLYTRKIYMRVCKVETILECGKFQRSPRLLLCQHHSTQLGVFSACRRASCMSPFVHDHLSPGGGTMS